MLYYIFNAKNDGRYKIQCILGNMVQVDNSIDISAITAQNSTEQLMLVDSMYQKDSLIIADMENVYSNTERAEKVQTRLEKGFGPLSRMIVRILQSVHGLVSSARSFQLHLKATLYDIGFSPSLYDENCRYFIRLIDLLLI